MTPGVVALATHGACGQVPDSKPSTSGPTPLQPLTVTGAAKAATRLLPASCALMVTGKAALTHCVEVIELKAKWSTPAGCAADKERLTLSMAKWVPPPV